MYDGDLRPRTIGILYPGEMGAALGRALRARGRRVVTSLDGRSSQTHDRAADAGIQVLDSLEQVVEGSHLIVSLVSPAAALSSARMVAACCSARTNAIYVDANSISPITARQIAKIIERAELRFVDAAIHGPASRLHDLGRLFLSGRDAVAAARLLDGIATVHLLGDEPGRASAMKMFLGGMVKGIAALFVELSVASRNLGLHGDFLAHLTDAYPGIMTLINRTLATYPRHSTRRVEEIQELEATLRSLGVKPRVSTAARRTIDRLAESDLHEYTQAIDDGLFDLDDLVELIALHAPLGDSEPSTSLNASACHA